jgi:hypothetical protein
MHDRNPDQPTSVIVRLTTGAGLVLARLGRNGHIFRGVRANAWESRAYWFGLAVVWQLGLLLAVGGGWVVMSGMPQTSREAYTESGGRSAGGGIAVEWRRVVDRPPSYESRRIEPPAGLDWAMASRVSNLGEVVGQLGTLRNGIEIAGPAFVWTEGRVTVLPAPGEMLEARARGISNSHLIVGHAPTSQRSPVWESSAVWWWRVCGEWEYVVGIWDDLLPEDSP